MKKAILIYLCSKHGIRPSDIVEFIKDYGFDYSVAFYQRHIELFKITYERYPKLRVLIDQLMVVNIDDEEQVEKEQKSFKW